jgi:hypothetical protein
MVNSEFWRDLEERFRSLQSALERRNSDLRANWISTSWNESGEQWYLSGVNDQRMKVMFEWIAERAALKLGHTDTATAVFAWLDLLKNGSPNFRKNVEGSIFDRGVNEQNRESLREKFSYALDRLRIKAHFRQSRHPEFPARIEECARQTIKRLVALEKPLLDESHQDIVRLVIQSFEPERVWKQILAYPKKKQPAIVADVVANAVSHWAATCVDLRQAGLPIEGQTINYEGGTINRLCEASADFCLKLENREMETKNRLIASSSQTAPAHGSPATRGRPRKDDERKKVAEKKATRKQWKDIAQEMNAETGQNKTIEAYRALLRPKK